MKYKPIVRNDVFDNEFGSCSPVDVIEKSRFLEFVNELKRRLNTKKKDFDILYCSEVIELIDKLAPLTNGDDE